MRAPVFTAVSALALLLAACGAAEEEASETPAAAPETSTSETDTSEVAARPVWVTPDLQPANLITEEGGVLRDAENRPLGYRLLGETLPLVEGEMLDGQAFSTAELEGQWTIIDVWGIWCSDCMADAPYVAALAVAVDQDPDLNFLSIHTPPSAERADEAYGKFGSVERFFENKGYSYPTVHDTDASLRDGLMIDWTPTYLLIGPDLTVEAFTTDLSVAGDQPVKDLLAAVAEIRAAQ